MCKTQLCWFMQDTIQNETISFENWFRFIFHWPFPTVHWTYLRGSVLTLSFTPLCSWHTTNFQSNNATKTKELKKKKQQTCVFADSTEQTLGIECQLSGRIQSKSRLVAHKTKHKQHQRKKTAEQKKKRYAATLKCVTNQQIVNRLQFNKRIG